ncbi:hypothetical protein GGX14DRAFT_468644 [Mycena pura]|uniref:Uncharacterized protein n=1 Tax=Mycena pura TaxID=153505 RepID=A0AAD6V0L4_9AGAR|nr:hypothetical protein GGX14DRAFT_468644 [Mycena pura]
MVGRAALLGAFLPSSAVPGHGYEGRKALTPMTTIYVGPHPHWTTGLFVRLQTCPTSCRALRSPPSLQHLP